MRLWHGAAKRIRGVVLVAVVALATPGCWWTQQGFGPGRTFANGSEDQLTPDTIGDAVPLWRDVDLRHAVVAGDTIYAVEGGQVSAYVARTGAVRWRQFLPPTAGPPLLDGGVLYVSSYEVTEVCDPTLPACFNRVTDAGIRRFTASTGAPLATIAWPQDAFAPVGPPVLAGRWLVVGRGFVPPRFSTEPSFDSYWMHDLTGAVADAVVAPANQDGLLPPVVDEARGQIVVGGASTVEAFALGCSGCAPRWSVAVGATALALSGDAVVLATGTGEVRVLDAATGAARASGAVDVGATSLAVDGGTIAARASARLWVFGGCAATGCPPTWTSSVPAHGQPVIAGELVYVNSAPGDDPPEGATLDVYRLGGCGHATCAPIARLAAFAGPVGVVVSDGLLVAQLAVFGL